MAPVPGAALHSSVHGTVCRVKSQCHSRKVNTTERVPSFPTFPSSLERATHRVEENVRARVPFLLIIPAVKFGWGMCRLVVMRTASLPRAARGRVQLRGGQRSAGAVWTGERPTTSQCLLHSASSSSPLKAKGGYSRAVRIMHSP